MGEVKISDHAIVRDCKVGEGTRIWQFANVYESEIGDNCTIGAYTEIQNGVKIGNNVIVCSHSFLCELVSVEDDVFIGHGVMTINDINPPSKKRTGNTDEWKPTLIKSGAVIGSNVTLFPITIGEGAKVGAGAVVTKDVPDYAIVVGNPGKVIGYTDGRKKIPLADLRAQHDSIKSEINSAINNVISKARYIGGDELKNFENNFAQYCGSNYCVGVDSGTAALYVTLRCLGIKSGDEVIMPANTFVATAFAATFLGAKPVFVDVNENDFLINVDLIRAAITTRTKAIIPVHLYGNVCDLDKIKEISDEHNLQIIEDCAQAHGAKYKGRRVPYFGIGCFSFFPAKNLGAYGDGGAIVCDDEKLAKDCQMFINHGRTDKYYHEAEGFNFRLDNLQAAILDVKLKHLDGWIKQKNKIAQKYVGAFKGKLKYFSHSPDVVHAHHLYVVRSKNRIELLESLKSKGIETGIHYPVPLHLQPVFSFLGYGKGDFPCTEKICEEILSIPFYPELKDFDQDEVIKSIIEVSK